MRLIDADRLKEVMCSKTYPVGDDFNNWDYGMHWTGGIERVIDKMPTIEAEPVIKCKDCKYFHDYGYGVKNCWGNGGGMKDDDFCSQAERKDGYGVRDEQDKS